MTAERPAGKAARPAPESLARHPFGPRAIGAVLPAITRSALRSQRGLAARLLIDWPAMIGPGLAAITAPRRFAAGTLTLGCAGPVALELQHLAPQLIERINAHLGQARVQRLRFMQEAIAVPPAITGRPRAASVPVAVDRMPDGPLRDALASLGGAIRADHA